MVSEQERIAHVVRRLGIGANPMLLASLDSVDDAIATMLDTSGPTSEPPSIDPPPTWDDVDYEVLYRDLVPWWLDTIASGRQPLVERLTWFWHHHFAVSGHKVDHSYVLWEHHRLVRRLATGSFSDLTHAVAVDPAMLWYLDGSQNTAEAPNENFGREVMELHTLGHGKYTQSDVTEIARAFTGWTVNEPHWERAGFEYTDAAPWSAVFMADEHDHTDKTVLGHTGPLDTTGAIDLLLEQDETGRHVAAELYRHLVGLEPPPATTQRLGSLFRRDYDIRSLVVEIVDDPAFTSDEAVRAKVRTPVEKAATVLQGLPRSADASGDWLFWILSKLHYVPLHPPNPAGFPPGHSLLDPARMLGAFELLHMAANVDEMDDPPDPLTALGLIDISDATRRLLDRFPRPGMRLGLAFGSPEFQVV